jgi:predicted Rdx family selenoprotein
MLRAAYFAQELLSTFGTTIGEIALVPATGGIFTVTLAYIPQKIAADSKDQEDKEDKSDIQVQTVLLWDRKAEGGFPGTSFQQYLISCTFIVASVYYYPLLLLTYY